MSDTSRSRHLSKDGFESFLTAGVPYDIPVDGSPSLTVFIRPRRGEIGLRADPFNVTGPSGRFPSGIELRSVYIGGRSYAEVVLNDPSLFVEGYGLLCAIADRVQLDRMTLLTAVELTIRNTRSLVAMGSLRLKRDDELGLLGELLVLSGLAGQLGEEEALAAWRGVEKQNAEHDFGLRDLDIEVKSTSLETRTHFISSATQLMPSKGRPLYLISNQLTEAGDGYGRSLVELVGELRKRFVSVERRAQFDAAVRVRGWPWPDVQLARWIYRMPSRIYAVDSDFPRLTNDLMAVANVDLARLHGVTYRIDLSTYNSQTVPPVNIAGVIADMEEL